MSIAKFTHNVQPPSAGTNVYIIRTPVRDFMGTRWGVAFANGEASYAAKNDALARRFDEELGYEVVLPTGHKRWKLAFKKTGMRGEEYDIQSAGIIQSVDESDSDGGEDEGDDGD